jgi:Ca2+-binding RTX toxin-like protein
MRSTTTRRRVAAGGVLLLGAATVISLATPADAVLTCGGFTQAQARALGYDTFVYNGQNQQVINDVSSDWDWIVTDGGNDIVNTAGGFDIICTRGDVDTVNSGGGADEVYAGGGSDDVSLGAGADYAEGGSGRASPVPSSRCRGSILTSPRTS